MLSRHGCWTIVLCSGSQLATETLLIVREFSTFWQSSEEEKGRVVMQQIDIVAMKCLEAFAPGTASLKMSASTHVGGLAAL